MLESIRQDPEYADGNYTKQPHSVRLASAFFLLPPPAERSIIRNKRRRAHRRTKSWTPVLPRR